MQTATKADRGSNETMEVDDGYTTQPNGGPDSQDSTLSDHVDRFISINDNFHGYIRQSNVDEIVKALSNESIDINRKNMQGDTALHIAVRRKNMRIIHLLIRHGADVTIKNNDMKTPLVIAEERLKKHPENNDLKSIHELLRRAQPGPSKEKTSIEGNDSDRIEPDPKRSRMDTSSSRSENGSVSRRFKGGQKAETYDSSGLRLNFHGPIYQTKLLALFVQRALKNNYKFELASEMDEAEKFDDIVLKYQTKPESSQWTWRFAQAKHKKDTAKKRITYNDLMSESDKNDFGLQKYFISFCKIKSRERFKKDGQCEDFTIITNAEFDPKFDHKSLFEQETNLDQDPILGIEGKKPKRFKLRVNETEKINLLEAFRSNLFDSVLKSKEIKHLNFCKKILTNLRNLPNEEKAKEQLPRAKEISKEIIVECSGKKRKRKSKLLEWAKDLKKCFEEFLNEKNHKELFESLKEIITILSKATADLIQDEKYCKNIISKTKNVVKIAEEFINNCIFTFANYNDSESDEFCGLENDKKKLIDDEIKLRNIRKGISEISQLNDIDRMKELIKQNEDVLTKNDRIPKNTISDLNKQKDLTQLQNELNKKLGNSITEISTILIALNSDTFKNGFNNFIQQFRIITNYPNEEGLSELLRTELSKEFNLLNIDLVSGSFEREMINFLKEYVGRFYSGHKGEEFLVELKQKVGSLMSVGLCESYTEQLENYNICFRNEFVALNKFLLSPYAKVLHLSDSKTFQSSSLTRLCAIQVYRHLANCGRFTANDSYIFIRLSTILHHQRTRKFILNSFQSNDQTDQNKNNIFDLCVIECRPECREGFAKESEREQELADEISDIILSESNKLKKLVLITPYDDTFAKHLHNKLQENLDGQEKCLKCEHEIQFSDLDDYSQDRVLAKKVNFQGNIEINFNQLIDNKDLANRLIDSENLLKLIESKLIQIGDDKPFRSIGFVKDYYIDRKFKSQKMFDNDSSILSEMNLVEFGRKVKLLSNDSGMGKSTTLTSVARNIRELSETTWIFRVNLIDYVSFIDTNEFHGNGSEIIHVVSKMLIRGKIDANTRIQRELLKVCLEEHGKLIKKPPIILLFDGFDEISPNYIEKTTTLLVLLKETNVSQLWITTRPHEKEHLANQLTSTVFYLQPLEKSEQKEFLNKFLRWHLNAMTVGKGEKIRERNYAQIIGCLKNVESRSLELKDAELSNTIHNILQKYPKNNSKKSNKFNELKEEVKTLSFTKYIDEILSVFAKDNEFHDTPLNLKILVEVICAENQLIEKFERFYLYDKFVNLRFNNFFHIKLKMLSKNVGAIENRDTGEKYLTNIHIALAVRILFPKNYEEKPLPDFDNLKIFEKETKRNKSDSTKKKDEKTRKEKKLLRVGLLTKRRDQFEFIHQSYAEFFFSKYLMKYLKRKHVQTIFIQNILLEAKYSAIRQFFNDQLKEPGTTAKKLKPTSKQFLLHHKKRIFALLMDENLYKIIELLKYNGLTG